MPHLQSSQRFKVQRHRAILLPASSVDVRVSEGFTVGFREIRRRVQGSISTDPNIQECL